MLEVGVGIGRGMIAVSVEITKASLHPQLRMSSSMLRCVSGGIKDYRTPFSASRSPADTMITCSISILERALDVTLTMHRYRLSQTKDCSGIWGPRYQPSYGWVASPSVIGKLGHKQSVHSEVLEDWWRV